MLNALPVALIAALLPNSQVAAAPSHLSCPLDQRAHIVRAVIPEYPSFARLEGLTGVATVRVDLSETGRVADVSLVRSAGSPILDRAALQVAKSMTYAPETKSCEPISGSYAVEVEYVDP
jgi:TonB family protein